MARRPVDLGSIDLSKYELAQPKSPSVSQEQPDALRTLGRTAARGIESVVGLPGDIASGVLGAANYLTGDRIPTYEQIQGNLPASLPTSQQVRKGTEALTGDYLKPRSRNEELYDEFIGDLATLAIPTKGKIPFKSALTRALGANLAGYAAESIGGEGVGKGTKIAYYLGSGLAGGRKALEGIQEASYKKATDAISPIGKAGYASENLNEGLKDLSKWTKSGIGTVSPEKKLLAELLVPIKERAKSGRVSVKQLWESKKDVNSLIGSPSTPKQAMPHLKRLSGVLNGELQAYGKSTNPEFLKFFNEAEDITRGLNKASGVNKFLNDYFDLNKILTNGTAKALFAGNALRAVGAPFTLAGGIAGNAAGKAAKSIELLKNSKQARLYYKNVLKSAASENKAAVASNLAKLNAVAEDYERKNPTRRQVIPLDSIDLSEYELA